MVFRFCSSLPEFTLRFWVGKRQTFYNKLSPTTETTTTLSILPTTTNPLLPRHPSLLLLLLLLRRRLNLLRPGASMHNTSRALHSATALHP
jgi:hypothetical protein